MMSVRRHDDEPTYDELLQEARRLRSVHEEDDPTPMYVEQVFLGARQQDAFEPKEG
jgi:hypothetical protein